MRLTLVLAASTIALALPGAAAAHGRGRPFAVDDRVTIDVRPPAVEARVVGGDRSLWLRVDRGVRVVVLGALREPTLRFGVDGVWANRASPTAAADGIVKAGGGWQRVAGGHAFAWHDHRLAPRGAPGAGRWAVPLLVDGRRTALGGTFHRVPPPGGWPWVAGAAATAAAIAVGATSRRVHRPKLAVALAVVAGSAAVAAVTGFAVHQAPAGGVLWFQVAVAALAAAAAGCALAFTKDSRRVVVAGVVGAVAALTVLGSVPIFRHGVVLSALAPTLARAICVTAFVCGVGAAVISVFADPVRERAR